MSYESFRYRIFFTLDSAHGMTQGDDLTLAKMESGTQITVLRQREAVLEEYEGESSPSLFEYQPLYVFIIKRLFLVCAYGQ